MLRSALRRLLLHLGTRRVTSVSAGFEPFSVSSQDHRLAAVAAVGRLAPAIDGIDRKPADDVAGEVTATTTRRGRVAGLKIAVCPIRGARSWRVAAFLRKTLKLEVYVTSRRTTTARGAGPGPRRLSPRFWCRWTLAEEEAADEEFDLRSPESGVNRRARNFPATRLRIRSAGSSPFLRSGFPPRS